jgi:hypothetical protein
VTAPSQYFTLVPEDELPDDAFLAAAEAVRAESFGHNAPQLFALFGDDPANPASPAYYSYEAISARHGVSVDQLATAAVVLARELPAAIDRVVAGTVAAAEQIAREAAE